MQGKWRCLLLGFLSLIALLLSSCGTSPHGGIGSANAFTPTPLGTVHPTGAAGTPAQTPPAQRTAIPGNVMITVAKSRYATNEDITATIVNGLSSSLEAMDHQFACTLLVLQQHIGNTWKNLVGCRLMTATRMVQIPAHTSLQQRVYPAGRSWSTGQYRFMLRYTPGTADTESRQSPDLSTIVYSADFIIA